MLQFCLVREDTRRGFGMTFNESVTHCSDSFFVIPDSPRCVSTTEHVFKVLLFLERIHARPKALMRISHQLAFANQTLERLFYQFFTVTHVIENFLPQDHKPAVDSRAGFAYVLDTLDDSSCINVDQMEASPGLDTHKAGNVAAFFEQIDDIGERDIRKTVGIVRQKDSLSCKVFLDTFETATDV